MQNVFDRDLLIQLLVGHTPLHKNLLTSSILGVWPVSQPPGDRDDLTDKSSAPMCPLFTERFHCHEAKFVS